MAALAFSGFNVHAFAEHPKNHEGAASSMSTLVSIPHISHSSQKPFADVIAAFESRLGRFDLGMLKMLRNGKDPEEAKREIEAMAAENGLMIINVIDHGALLRIAGKSGDIMLYEIGNPLYALQMTQHDPRAGLYAPLRVVIYSDQARRTHVEYDLPSAFFGQIGNTEIDKVAKSLDAKLEELTNSALK